MINRPAFLGFPKGPPERKPKPEEVDICKLEWPEGAVLLADSPSGAAAPPCSGPWKAPPRAAGRHAGGEAAEGGAERGAAAGGALEELRRACGRRSWRSTGWPKKSAQQEWLIAHLERFNAQVLEENGELRQLLENGAVDA